MYNDPVREYESLKSRVDELKLKRLSDLRERERLDKEFQTISEEIQAKYNVPVEDFSKAIEELKIELSEVANRMRHKIAECDQAMGALE